MFRKLIAVLMGAAFGLGAGASSISAQPGQPATETAPSADPAPVEAVPAEAAQPEAVPAEAATDAPAETAPSEGEAPAEEAAPAPTTAAEESAKAEAAGEPVYAFTDVQPDSYWMPAKAAGETMDHVDWMFYAILGLSIFCFVAITFAVVYLAWRYRHRPGHRAEPSKAHDNVLEVTWTIIPSIICVFIFIGGWKGYLNMTTAPHEALEINVSGIKWNWSFTYEKDTETVSNVAELHVPVDRPVKLIMRSEDVLHSFYIPAMRTKQDVIPGRYSYVWFEADKPGVYRVYCAEYCGDSHADMKTKVIVHEPGGYEKWLNAEWEKGQVDCRELPEAERDECYMTQGQRIYENLGCKQCHSLDGGASTGPTFKGMWGENRSFADGSTGAVDENYVRESVLDPMAKVRSGFNPVMPTFKGKLKDKDVDALNNWMKTL